MSNILKFLGVQVTPRLTNKIAAIIIVLLWAVLASMIAVVCNSYKNLILLWINTYNGSMVFVKKYEPILNIASILLGAGILVIYYSITHPCFIRLMKGFGVNNIMANALIYYYSIGGLIIAIMCSVMKTGIVGLMKNYGLVVYYYLIGLVMPEIYLLHILKA